MQIIDGKEVSASIRQELKSKVQQRQVQNLKTPHLAAILVGDDPASHTYVNSKIKACEEIGYKSSLFLYDNSITEQALLNKIIDINNDEDINGLIVQLPLPRHIDVTKVIETISPDKDVDGFHPINVGRMTKDLTGFLPATPFGILKLLDYYNIDIKGKHCVVVGRSLIVGTPMSVMLSRDNKPGNATVTLCHRYTEDLEKYTTQADVLITAIGQPGFFGPGMIKEGAVVIDVGTTRVEDATKKSGFRLRGDVDFEQVKDKCSYITPVPGGVGPMTIACLLLNTWRAVEKSDNK